jgi:hypothetical protein
MVLLPRSNLPALRVSVAVPLALRGAEPRTEVPAENVTVPDVAGFTVAVNAVLCVVEMLAGFAERLVVVEILVVEVPVRVTVTDAVAPVKEALPP